MLKKDKREENTIKALENNVKDLQEQLAWAYKRIGELQNIQHDNPVLEKWSEVKNNIEST